MSTGGWKEKKRHVRLPAPSYPPPVGFVDQRLSKPDDPPVNSPCGRKLTGGEPQRAAQTQMETCAGRKEEKAWERLTEGGREGGAAERRGETPTPPGAPG